MARPEIDLIYFDGCPNVGRARENLRTAVPSGADGEGWREWNLSSEETPQRYRRFGSPTVLVDGRDVTGEGEGEDNAAMACRAGGAPTPEVIRKALAHRG